MYDFSLIENYIYLMLYGAVAMLDIVACLYLWLRPRNMFYNVEPPTELRCWTAAFMAAMAMSHIWWSLLGPIWDVGDQLTRVAIACCLDTITLVPLAIIIMLRMLQDRRRPLWPVWLAMVPALFITLGVGAIGHSYDFVQMLAQYIAIVGCAYAGYILYSLRDYRRWLRENYADLENKEVWHSTALLLCLMLMFTLYKFSTINLFTEFAIQVLTIVIVAVLIWRVESLQMLDEVEKTAEEGEEEQNEETTRGATFLTTIGGLLKNNCEDTQLYLQHDLSLAKLCTAIGTNRTYLSTYFKQNGTTYNAYINRLRIKHFMRLCHETLAAGQPFSAQQTAQLSGFQSYRTFSATFKQFNGMTASEWIEQEKKLKIED